MERMTMQIGGMSCGHCVAQVSRALKDLDGVEVEQVAVGSATVRYDDARTPRAKITSAIAEAGYTVVDAR